MSIRNFVGAGFLGMALIAGSAEASTLTEGVQSFSGSWVAPVAVASGTTDISGSGTSLWNAGDRFDIFHFAGLVPGETSIAIDFALTGLNSLNSYKNGGGSVYYSYVPFTNDYTVDLADGQVLGSSDLLAGKFDVTFDPWKQTDPAKQGTSSFTLNLGDDFAGDLFMALDFEYGDVSYNINSLDWSASSAPSPVPLPASGLLVLAAFLSLGFLTGRRNRSLS